MHIQLYPTCVLQSARYSHFFVRRDQGLANLETSSLFVWQVSSLLEWDLETIIVIHNQPYPLFVQQSMGYSAIHRKIELDPHADYNP